MIPWHPAPSMWTVLWGKKDEKNGVKSQHFQKTPKKHVFGLKMG